jgi:hypothetical protein
MREYGYRNTTHTRKEADRRGKTVKRKTNVMYKIIHIHGRMARITSGTIYALHQFQLITRLPQGGVAHQLILE